jgi:hydroxyacylglutathione hydrolase
MFFETIRSEGLAHQSYLFGSDGVAAVIDPRRDCEVYLERAAAREAAIARIFETHRNEDYLVGSPELARRTGATVHHGARLDFAYGSPVRHGDRFELGSLAVVALETPAIRRVPVVNPEKEPYGLLVTLSPAPSAGSTS